jgi:hypothetical protein
VHRRSSSALVTALILATLALIVPAGATAAAPPNDAFADRISIPFGDLPFDSDPIGLDEATREGGEPSACGSETGTAWFRVTATTTTYLHATLTMDDLYPLELAVYRGTSLGGLQLVDCGDADYGDQRVTWKAAKGVAYVIQVSGWRPSVYLHVRKAKAPSNDDFASARTVSALPTVHVTDLINATWQTGEPDPTEQPVASPCVDDRRGRTIWYRYRPSRTGVVRVDTFLSGAPTWISVHRGSTLGGLTPVDCNDDITEVGTGEQSNVAWKAVAGKTYHIQVGGTMNMADLAVRFRRVTPLPNDDFAGAATLPQDGTVRTVDTRLATREAGERFPEGMDNPGASVWYRFSPTASGTYHLDTQGSADIDVEVAVYRGSSAGSLVLIDHVGAPRYEPLAFPATAGEQYRIQVFGEGHDAGRVHLHLKQAP